MKCLGTFLVEGNDQMHQMEALLHGPPLDKSGKSDDPMRLWSPFYADKLGKNCPTIKIKEIVWLIFFFISGNYKIFWI